MSLYSTFTFNVKFCYKFQTKYSKNFQIINQHQHTPTHTHTCKNSFIAAVVLSCLSHKTLVPGVVCMCFCVHTSLIQRIQNLRCMFFALLQLAVPGDFFQILMNAVKLVRCWVQDAVSQACCARI